MKLIKRLLFASIIFANIHIQAIIFESDNLKDIYNYANKDTLVVFDMDDTLVSPPGYIGSSVWLEYEIANLQKKGFSFDKALVFMLPTYFTIHEFMHIDSIGNCPEIIDTLQKKNLCTMILTNRSMPMVNITLRELKRLNIDLSINSLYKKDLDISIQYKAIFSNGVIFAASNNKGEILCLFLEKIGYTPKKIIFVDDKLKHVKSVEAATEKRGIEFVGIRYSLQDEYKKNFDSAIADQQFHALKVTMGLEPLG